VRLDINADHRDQRRMTPAQLRAPKEREAELRKLGYAGGDADDGPRRTPLRRKDEPPRNPGQQSRLDAHELGRLRRGERSDPDLVAASERDLRDRPFDDEPRSEGLERRQARARRRICSTASGIRATGAAEPTPIASCSASTNPSGSPRVFRARGTCCSSTTSTRRRRAPRVRNSALGRRARAPVRSKLGFTREAGKPFGPSAPVWSYTAPTPHDFHSFFISGAQRLPNGNTLICTGQSGRFFEVKPDGANRWGVLEPLRRRTRVDDRQGEPQQGARVTRTDDFRSSARRAWRRTIRA
jgi:hypothetical protein